MIAEVVVDGMLAEAYERQSALAAVIQIVDQLLGFGSSGRRGAGNVVAELLRIRSGQHGETAVFPQACDGLLNKGHADARHNGDWGKLRKIDSVEVRIREKLDAHAAFSRRAADSLNGCGILRGSEGFFIVKYRNNLISHLRRTPFQINSVKKDKILYTVFEKNAR